jgi:hypothetical protein
MDTAPHKTKETLAAMYDVYTDAEIAKICRCSTGAVRWWRRKLGIATKPWRRRKSALPIDQDFFSDINTEAKAYFLGFLTADGYVSKSGRTVSCCVSAGDVHILEDLRDAAGSGARITDKKVAGYPGSKPQKVIVLSSKKLVGDLAIHGVVPNKTHTIRYADVTPELERHYIRGIVDGDGYIGKQQFAVVGTSALLDGITAAVRRHTGCALVSSPMRGCPRIVGSRRDRDALRWLYDGAVHVLSRKHQNFVEFWQ